MYFRLLNSVLNGFKWNYCFCLYLLFSVFLSNSFSVFSQTPTNQDCPGAIVICQNTFSQSNSFTGTGNIPNEIHGGFGGTSCLSTGERNDVWYTLTVQTSGLLNFSITPNVFGEDYDWAVWNLTNATCADIYNNASIEVSCNFNGTAGVTGANGLPGGQNNPPIPVLAGQTYVINISNFSSTQGGYLLDFTASSAQIFDNIPPRIDSIFTVVHCGGDTIAFRFSENILCTDVTANKFTITGPGGPYTVNSVSSAGCLLGNPSDRIYTVRFSPPIASGGNFNFTLITPVSDLCNNMATVPANTPFTITSLLLNTTSTPDTCNKGVGTATVIPPAGNVYTYIWSPGNGTTAKISGLNAGAYNVTVSLGAGCPQSTFLSVQNLPSPVAAFTAYPLVVSNKYPLCTFTNNSVNAITYNWDFGDSTHSQQKDPQHSYQTTGTFRVLLEVTNAFGCSDTISVLINVVMPTAWLPNSFTPNGDGKNDSFGLIGESINPDQYEMTIYNRWGMQVYRTRNLDILWDGFSTYANLPAESGVYIYVIIFKDIDDKTHQVIGKVSLIR